MKWTLNTVWYLFLEVLQAHSIKVTRGYVKRLVKELCEAAGVTRESLGIYAGVRAELYFKGDWSSVSFDSVGALAEKGTDIVFVEKEGIPEVLTDFADTYGIALVNTRGHLTEYGKDLMTAAKDSGANVVIMTDYDATGVKIASESPTEMPWIGANDEMLRYFKLDRDSVSIATETNANKDYVRDLVSNGRHRDGRRDQRFRNVDVEFLYQERVELDAILAKVGDERYFQYILDTLKELYPIRNYTRAIEIPSDELEAKHEESLDLIKARVKEVIDAESKKIEEELSQVEGFIKVEEKLDEIKQRLVKTLDETPHYEDFVNKLADLVKSHEFFKKDEDEDKDQT
jgi:Protein of unknown function C-terminus (DUF2399)